MGVELGAEPATRLDEQAVVLDLAGAGTARPAARVDEVVTRNVAVSKATLFDQRFRSVDEADIGSDIRPLGVLIAIAAEVLDR